MVGIVSYGTYIPKYRIKVGEIAAVWQKPEADVIRSLGIDEKAVPAEDEDTVTLAIEAASQALNITSIQSEQIGAILVGSESHPYAVNPTSTIVGEFLGIGNYYLACDLEFACKAATTAMIAITGLISSDQINLGLAIGADVAQSKPHDVLEYSASAGSSACVLGKQNIAVELIDLTSFSSDTPDFWRRDGIKYPSHTGRFSGQPAYFTHVTAAATKLLKQVNTTPEKIDYCVFHMPNSKFPASVANKLGFTANQLEPSLIVNQIGNPYSASSLLGLAAVLDQAKPGQMIFMVSYGSGAGSDAFLWQIKPAIKTLQRERQQRKLTINDYLVNKKYISYAQYLKQTHKI